MRSAIFDPFSLFGDGALARVVTPRVMEGIFQGVQA